MIYWLLAIAGILGFIVGVAVGCSCMTADMEGY